MATQTTNYGLVKPDLGEKAQITVLNGDLDSIDSFFSFVLSNFAPNYDNATSYQVGDLCIYGLRLYKCTAAATGSWDPSKWVLTTIMDEFTRRS